MILTITGAALCVVAFATQLTGRLAGHRALGLVALGNLATAIDALRAHDQVVVAVNGGVAAMAAWAWWKGGGGDGTKRRLRELGRRFQGVRRTAPMATRIALAR
jgi:hypothetical protein